MNGVCMVRRSSKVVPPDWLAFYGRDHIDAFHMTCAGDEQAATSLFVSLEYANQLRLVHEFWQLKQVGKITSGVWSTILFFAWTGGRRGSILTDALSKLDRGEIAKMFLEVDKRALMDDVGLARYESLPDNFSVYRGCGRFSPHTTNGISWTTNRDQAEWFALRARDNRTNRRYACQYAYGLVSQNSGDVDDPLAVRCGRAGGGHAFVRDNARLKCHIERRQGHGVSALSRHLRAQQNDFGSRLHSLHSLPSGGRVGHAANTRHCPTGPHAYLFCHARGQPSLVRSRTPRPASAFFPRLIARV